VLGDLAAAPVKRHGFTETDRAAANQTCEECSKQGRGELIHDTDHVLFDCCTHDEARQQMRDEIDAERAEKRLEDREREEKKAAERALALSLHNAGGRGPLDLAETKRGRGTTTGKKHEPHKLEILFQHPLPVVRFLDAIAGPRRNDRSDEATTTGTDTARAEQVFGRKAAKARGTAANSNNNAAAARTSSPKAYSAPLVLGKFDLAGAAGGSTITVARIEGDRIRAAPTDGDEHIVRAADIARLNELGRESRSSASSDDTTGSGRRNSEGLAEKGGGRGS
jgi:hypothetical protein